MLFSANISMQPKKDVIVERKVPTKVFAKLFHTMTQGVLSPKEKHQTFTAVSILQELNIALRQAGIVNIVRLAKDGNDFYYDDKGKDDDLADAMKEFRLNTDKLGESLFEDLYMVLEHKEDTLRYLMEIDIKRVHLAEEMPINITINGVINELEAKPGESKSQVENRVKSHMGAQTEYNQYIAGYKTQFNVFVGKLEQTLRSAIRCEEIKQHSKPQILRPANKGATTVTDRKRAPLVHRGYPGWEFAALYTFMWMPMMSSAAIVPENVEVISDGGDVLQSIDPGVTDAGASELFDMDIATGDLPLDNQNRFDASSAGASVDTGESSSSWLDFGGGDSGGSSCSSGCGGGCGS